MARRKKVVNLRPQARADVARALRDLRASLDLSQEAFAHSIGKTVRTVARYESSLPIGWDALLELAAIAERKQQPELAKVFRRAAEALILDYFNAYFERNAGQWLSLLPHLDELRTIIHETDAALKGFEANVSSSGDVIALLALVKENVHKLALLLNKAPRPRSGGLA
jgi:transcriptional regulator with XRE-family HTH domain